MALDISRASLYTNVMKSTNITRVPHLVARPERWRRKGHKGGVLWLTGLPAAGKKTLAAGLEARLFEQGYDVFAFDSGFMRQGLSRDLGFTREGRRENIRRAGELAAVMASAGMVVITAFIAPYAADRAAARKAAENFHEVFLDVPAELCEARDPDNRYARARAGEIEDFTGVTAPYEAPQAAEVRLTPTGGAVDTEAWVVELTAYVETHFRDLSV
ncbi:MAG: adenylyl-sulfate kinase [Rhodospirillaceae bacterium]